MADHKGDINQTYFTVQRDFRANLNSSLPSQHHSFAWSAFTLMEKLFLLVFLCTTSFCYFQKKLDISTSRQKKLKECVGDKKMKSFKNQASTHGAGVNGRWMGTLSKADSL